MYVIDVGRSTSSTTSPTTTVRTRRTLRPTSPPPFAPPNCIDDRRSLIELPMKGLLVTIGAHHIPAGEAYQIVVCARAMNRTHQVGRAIDSPPVACLAKPDTHWCEIHDQVVEEGGRRYAERNEQHTL